MEKLWDSVKESVYGPVMPQDSIKLPTTIVKILLGMFLGQSALIALWWSIKDHVFYPWLLFLSTFLQIGWFWSKVTMSWQQSGGSGPTHPHPLFSSDTVDGGGVDNNRRQATVGSGSDDSDQSVSAPELSLDNVGELRFAADSEKGPLTGSTQSTGQDQV